MVRQMFRPDGKLYRQKDFIIDGKPYGQSDVQNRW